MFTLFKRLILFFVLVFGSCKPVEQGLNVYKLSTTQSLYEFEVTVDNGQIETVRLAGVRGPFPAVFPEQARVTSNLIASQLSRSDIQLKFERVGQPSRDRYGRLAVSVYRDNENFSEYLVSQGYMMVWPRITDQVNYEKLYNAESQARSKNLGGWANENFNILDTDVNRLAMYLDGPVIIEGRVIGVNSARDGRIFLNFGLDWRTDFTAIATAKKARRFLDSGLDLQNLDGAYVRVRGWLVDENGPAIFLDDLNQVEIVGNPDPVAFPS